MLAVNRRLKSRREHDLTGLVFVDLSKAFDRVRYHQLIQDLFNIGLCGPVLELFVSYLQNRRQRVVHGGSRSQYAECIQGVPQAVYSDRYCSAFTSKTWPSVFRRVSTTRNLQMICYLRSPVKIQTLCVKT